MAGPAPNTKGWTARENKHKPKGLHLIVTGTVEVSATNKAPVLTEAPHAGKVLPLDLTISESGEGDQLMVWKPAFFHQVVSANEFDKVDIRWDGKTIASCPVVDDSEFGQALVEQMETVNADHAGEKGPERSARSISRMAAAKKAAAERAAQVKAAQAMAAQNSAVSGGKKPSTAKKVVKTAVDAVKEVVGKVAEAVTGGAKKRSKKVKKRKKTAKKTKAVGGWAKKRTKKAAKKAPKAKKKKSAKKTKKAKAKKRRR
jgi:hypothetical protein